MLTKLFIRPRIHFLSLNYGNRALNQKFFILDLIILDEIRLLLLGCLAGH